MTDGSTRELKIGGRTVRFRHAGPSVMQWAGKPAAPVAQALRWLGPDNATDPQVISTLRRHLSDDVKRDLVQNSGGLPGWALPLAHSIAADQLLPYEWNPRIVRVVSRSSRARQAGRVRSGSEPARYAAQLRRKGLLGLSRLPAPIFLGLNSLGYLTLSTVLGQLRPALAAQHRLGKQRRRPSPVRAVVRAEARGVA